MAKKQTNTATGGMALAPKDSPDFTKREVTELARVRSRCRDLYGSDTASGTDMMHAKSETYLPKWAGEDKQNYKIRATLTELYGAFERCINAAVGLVFAKPPTIAETAAESFKAHWKDLDGMGTHAKVFQRGVFTDGLLDGVVAILVEYPKVERPSKVTLQDRARLGLRPRWVKVLGDQIINWRIAKVGGKLQLTMVVIHECVDDEDGAFGSTEVEQFRVLQLAFIPARLGGDGIAQGVFYTVWRYRDELEGTVKKRVWFIHDEGTYKGITRIPLAIGHFSTPSATLVAKPPCLALADLSLGHYRVSADRRYMISLVHAPTPTIEGWVEPQNPDGSPAVQQEMLIGPGAALRLPPGQTFQFVQADPGGLDSSKEEKDDLIAQMASMSIAFLAQERRQQETATAHRIATAAQNATLAIAAQAAQDLFSEALSIHAEYLQEAPPEITVQTSYEEETLDAQTISALNQLEKDANLTKGTLLTILKRGKIIPDDIDITEEEALLMAEAAARQQQQADLLVATANAGGDAGGKKPPVAARAKKTAKKKKAPAAA